jgi:hypothetical protein
MSLNESISVILQTIHMFSGMKCKLKFSLEIYWISIKFWALLTFTFADQMFLAVLFFLSFTFLFFKHTRLHCLATRFELNCPEAQGYFLTWLLKHSVTMDVLGYFRPKTKGIKCQFQVPINKINN